MRLLYIFPRTTPDAGEREAEHSRRREILQRAAAPGTTVDIRELEGCPPAIESRRDAYAVAPAVISMAERLQSQYDAMIVGCFSDPAVDGALEATTLPIIGCGLPSMAAALLLGGRFAVLSPSAASAAHVRDLVMAAGLTDRYAGALPLGIGVREFAVNPSRTLEVISESARQAVAGGADVILLGCLSLAFTGAGDELQDRLGVPIVNPLRVAIGTAEMLVAARLSPRRLSAPSPPQQDRVRAAEVRAGG